MVRMQQSFFILLIKDIEVDRVNLNIFTAISKIVYQNSMVKSHRPMDICLKKQDMFRLETVTKKEQIYFSDVVY